MSEPRGCPIPGVCQAEALGWSAPLTWTKTPPTEPGPHWIRIGQPGGLQRRTIVRVRRGKLDGALFVRWAGKRVSLEALNAEWSDRSIAMPREP